MTLTNLSSDYFANQAVKAMLLELSASPTPGLVDRYNNGAHRDMDFYLFLDSAFALQPFFRQYFEAGLSQVSDLSALFDELRRIGILAEQAMFQATQGVNTHKGMNFSFAIILGASAYHLKDQDQPNFSPQDSQAILNLCGQMTQDLIAKDFSDLDQKSKLTHGERLYLEHGITGIRGQAAAGYPAIGDLILPYWRQTSWSHVEEALLRGLVLLMSLVEDGNLINRGGIQAWRRIQRDMTQIHQAQLSYGDLRNRLADYDQELIDLYLSPGGSADLLALAAYFALLEGIF